MPQRPELPQLRQPLQPLWPMSLPQRPQLPPLRAPLHPFPPLLPSPHFFEIPPHFSFLDYSILHTYLPHPPLSYYLSMSQPPSHPSYPSLHLSLEDDF